MYPTKIYAHRGASAEAPENTMEAFHLAHQQGADGIEFDVHYTKDGQLAILHDEDIARTANGHGLVKDMDLATLRGYNYSNNNADYPSAGLPILEDILAAFHKTDMLYNIELKNNIFRYEGMEGTILKLVKHYDCLEKTIFSSFRHESVLFLRRIEPRAHVAFLFSDGIADVAEYMHRHRVQTAHPAHPLCNTQADIDYYHANGIRVNTWTVNAGSAMRRLCDLGVDGIITNRPSLGVEIRNDGPHKRP